MAPQRQKLPPAPGPVRRSTRIQQIHTAREAARSDQDQEPKVAKKSLRGGNARVAKRGASNPVQPTKLAATNKSKTRKRTKTVKSESQGAVSRKREKQLGEQLEEQLEEKLERKVSANKDGPSTHHETQPLFAVAEENAAKPKRKRNEQNPPASHSNKRARLQIDSTPEEATENAAAEASETDQARSRTTAAKQIQDLDDLETPNLVQSTASADIESLCAALEKWPTKRVQDSVSFQVQASKTASIHRSALLPEAQAATQMQSESPIIIEEDPTQQPSNPPGIQAASLGLNAVSAAVETQPRQRSNFPSEMRATKQMSIPGPANELNERIGEKGSAKGLSDDQDRVPRERQVGLFTTIAEPQEIAKGATKPANDEYIDGVSDAHDSKERRLLSALMSLALANRGLSYEIEDVDYLEHEKQDLKDRIREIDFDGAHSGYQGYHEADHQWVQDAKDPALVDLELNLEDCERQLEHRRCRVEAMQERVTSGCRALADVEALSPDDFLNDDEETERAMQCLAQTNFWAQFDVYRCARSRANAITEELESLRQEQSAISNRTILFGKDVLDLRLTRGMKEGDGDPRNLNPWYMPDLDLAGELIERKRKLERASQTCCGLDHAQSVAISSERALVDAGLLRQRSVGDEDQLDQNGVTVEAQIDQGEKAEPSRDQLYMDYKNALAEFTAVQKAFEADEYRMLTPDELTHLPQPVSEEDEGVALFKKLQERTRAYRRAEENSTALRQRCLDAGIIKAQDDATSFSVNRSYGERYSEALLLYVKSEARLKLDKWLSYDQDHMPAPLASVENAAFVSAVPANERSLQSLPVGRSLSDARMCMANRIVEMRRRSEQLRNLENGELVLGDAVAMVKRPFKNAQNDFHSASIDPGDLDKNPSQDLAEEATSGPIAEYSTRGRASSRSFPNPRDVPEGWNDNAMDGYDGENLDGIE